MQTPLQSSYAPYSPTQLSAFDLDAYAAEYTGRTRITRLIAIDRCLLDPKIVLSPSGGDGVPESSTSGLTKIAHASVLVLQRRALMKALPIIKEETLDVRLYGVVIAELAGYHRSLDGGSETAGESISASNTADQMQLDSTSSSTNLSTSPIAIASSSISKSSSSFIRPSSLTSHMTNSNPNTSTSPTSSTSALTSQEFLGIPDEAWIRRTRSKAQKEKDKLDVEMKNYTVNLIKESIRLTHHAIATHLRQVGDSAGALKSFARAREFNSNAVHELESSMGIVEVCLDVRNFGQANPAIIKAEYAINRMSSNIKPNAAMMGPSVSMSSNPSSLVRPGGPGSAASSHVMTGAQERANVEKQREADENQARTGIKLRVARGLCLLQSGGAAGWEGAAREFLGIKGGLGDWEGKVISSSDIAIYTALTALATMPRSAIMTELLENASMMAFIDHGNGDFVKELLVSFVEAKYEKVLRVLHENKLRLEIDPFLSHQVKKLIEAITHRAYLQYFAPFQNVQVARMAAAFGYTRSIQVAQLVDDLRWLIGKGRLNARLDAIDNVLYAVKTDHRKELFANALGTGRTIEATTQKAMLRLKFLEAKLFVETKKDRDDRLSKQSSKQHRGGDTNSGAGGDHDMEMALAASMTVR